MTISSVSLRLATSECSHSLLSITINSPEAQTNKQLEHGLVSTESPRLVWVVERGLNRSTPAPLASLWKLTPATCFHRIIVRMANYNQTTQEITRPSELLVGLRSYTASLQSLSSYINVDVTRLVKNVLLQQTMPQDSRGSPTITTLYSNWFVPFKDWRI